MHRKGSIIFSSIALVLLGGAGLSAAVTVNQCLGSIRVYAPPCVRAFAVEEGVLLTGAGFTVLLLVVHLITAAKRHSWGWVLALLAVPPFCFYGGFQIVRLGDPVDAMLFGCLFFALSGLPNLLFSKKVLMPKREAATSPQPVEAQSG